MAQVWLSARRAFTFKGRSYAAGEVFQSSPLEAVQMRAVRAVLFSKAPAAVPKPVAEAPPPAPARRRYTRPASPVSTTTATAAVNQNVDASLDWTIQPNTAAAPPPATPED